MRSGRVAKPTPDLQSAHLERCLPDPFDRRACSTVLRRRTQHPGCEFGPQTCRLVEASTRRLGAHPAKATAPIMAPPARQAAEAAAGGNAPAPGDDGHAGSVGPELLPEGAKGLVFDCDGEVTVCYALLSARRALIGTHMHAACSAWRRLMLHIRHMHDK